MSENSLAEVILWLKSLQTEIGSWGSGKQRPLTDDEWDKIKISVDSHQLLCMLHHHSYGFFLTIHEKAFLKGIQPDLLITIDDLQFPFPSATQGFQGQLKTLKLLQPLTHNERNQELLAWCGFEELKPIESYVY